MQNFDNFATAGLDAMMKDIIDIFHLEGVELVRLSGLLKREINISGSQVIDADMLDKIIHKMKLQGIINYDYILKCPFCKETTYQITKRESPTKAKICDTCQSIYIPTKDVSLLELSENYK